MYVIHTILDKTLKSDIRIESKKISQFRINMEGKGMNLNESLLNAATSGNLLS